jgi:hypothetical protein
MHRLRIVEGLVPDLRSTASVAGANTAVSGVTMLKSFLIVAALMVGLTVEPAFAGSKALDGSNNCPSLNCSSHHIQGFVDTNEPFVSQVFARAGECLSVDVVRSSTDTVLAVLSPDLANTTEPAVWLDPFGDDPRIEIDPTPATGWYVVVVGASRAARARFSLAYGRYTSGNPNCEFPTPPPPRSEDQ